MNNLLSCSELVGFSQYNWFFKQHFLTFPVGFWIPIIFSNVNLSCSYVLYLRNLQEQFKKAFCLIVHSSDLKLFFKFFAFSFKLFKSFSQSWDQFFSHRRSEQFWKQNTIHLPARLSAKSPIVPGGLNLVKRTVERKNVKKTKKN